jgi:hypothetical protein
MSENIEVSEDVGEFETVEPNWTQLFKYAELLVSNADELDGRDFIIEMLQFGKRLEEQRIEVKNNA